MLSASDRLHQVHGFVTTAICAVMTCMSTTEILYFTVLYLGGTIVLKQVQKVQEIYLLGYGDEALSAMSGPNGLSITFPKDVPLGSLQHAWVFKLLHVQ